MRTPGHIQFVGGICSSDADIAILQHADNLEIPGLFPYEMRKRPMGRPPDGPLSMWNHANPSGGKKVTAPADVKSTPVEIRPKT